MLATFEPPTQTVGPFGVSDDHIHLSIPEIKKRIDEWLYDAMNGVVQSGPI